MGVEQTVDCGSNPAPYDTCGWSEVLGRFDCGGPDPVPDGVSRQLSLGNRAFASANSEVACVLAALVCLLGPSLLCHARQLRPKHSRQMFAMLGIPTYATCSSAPTSRRDQKTMLRPTPITRTSCRLQTSDRTDSTENRGTESTYLRVLLSVRIGFAETTAAGGLCGRCLVSEAVRHAGADASKSSGDSTRRGARSVRHNGGTGRPRVVLMRERRPLRARTGRSAPLPPLHRGHHLSLRTGTAQRKPRPSRFSYAEQSTPSSASFTRRIQRRSTRAARRCPWIPEFPTFS